MVSTACKFKRVLVANRGEIARRIIRTLREMGIESHAVFSPADEHSLHVKEADFSHALGANPAAESYLNISKIIKIARAAAVDAIHPGYGFLSENPKFAQACKKAGIEFIGPSAAQMEILGSKIRAKELCRKLKIPTLDSLDINTEASDSKKLRLFAKKEGLPLVIKAAAGGGGRGMRVVRKISEIEELVQSAELEAKSAFGDGSLYIERFIEGARHIEVQIIADKYGKVTHLFDRDCSLQRKHQKVIEEAPATDIPESVRTKMRDSAIRLCESAGYSSLATVEFLLDRKNKFHFLEINTRLQVEHTVSEQITGLDFVALQVRIAQGAALKTVLPRTLKVSGHAIQARLCADWAERDFRPCSGEISCLQFPSSPQLRIDSGFQTGDRVSPYYDSLVAKIIVHSESRSEAISSLLAALKNTAFLGISNNLSFLIALCASQEFSENRVHTRFIDKFVAGLPWAQLYTLPATIYHAFRLSEQEKVREDIWDLKSGWRIFQQSDAGIESKYLINQEIAVACKIKAGQNCWEFELDGNSYKLEIEKNKKPDQAFKFRLNGRQDDIVIRPGRDNDWVASAAGSFSIAPHREKLKIKSKKLAHEVKEISSPLPGKILQIWVSKGAAVKAGAKLLSLESMKMEHIIRAEHDLRIEELLVRPNQMVQQASVLIKVG